MNFLLFRGTFLHYSQLRNNVEDSCKSLGQTPSEEQEQPTTLQQDRNEWLVEGSSPLRKTCELSRWTREENKHPPCQVPQHSRLTCFRQPVDVSIFAI